MSSVEVFPGLKTTPHVYAAINQVTAAMAGEGLSKARKNDQQGYRFRGIDDVYNALARHLADAKLCILPRVLSRTVMERPTKSGGGISTFAVLDVEFDLVSAVDGSKHTIRTMGEAMDTADKATNKAMSAAMKYACLLAFQIPTEGDNEADAHHIEPAESDLTGKLAQSIDWSAWESKQIAKLRSAKTMGQLQETWADVYQDAKSAPPSARDRLSAEKNALKAELSGTIASAQ